MSFLMSSTLAALPSPVQKASEGPRGGMREKSFLRQLIGTKPFVVSKEATMAQQAGKPTAEKQVQGFL